jgi:chemosensory pili system protein ChpC
MIQTEETSTVVRVQLLPLSEMQLVLPNTSIAEIINLLPIEPIKKSADWLLGMANWRGIQIPTISFEKANGVSSSEPSKNTRIAVLNSFGSDKDLSFYGVITQGIPKLLSLDKTAISTIKKPDIALPIALQQVDINGVSAVIPDQKQIEMLLKKQLVKVK